ncbi:EF-hand domain-containing protein [Streptomyces sp. HNM0574]|uniref:EF-hand domain-containing protein n=1 Tax=Streptomyces sp. HNM0574 TaxID=2714954 RepID=UPI00146F85E8|nr:EF-hand domain-containing protein [Streptomyces sp. HNM0574]NLU69319.1 EF-hand domain-containing protein [Streptomyces sp. HNM0574]
MDSIEYERKIAARFASFDQDGNGYISREDFTTAAAAVRTEFGVTARSEQGQALLLGAEAFWQGMAGIADHDGDQRITREEFVGSAVKRLRDNAGRFAEIARPFLHAVLALADSDGDGRVAPEEAARALRALGVPEEVAGEAARALGTDADGLISESGIVTAFAAYFTTPEPDA